LKIINEKALRFFCAGLTLASALGAAADGTARSSTAIRPIPALQVNQGLSAQEILQAAAENGRLALAALREYTYYTELTIETLSQADTVTGKYYRFTEVSFDGSGNRHERNLESTSTLPKDVYIGASSADNLIRIYQFVITPETLHQYEFNYVGREQVDELRTYVFDVQPGVKMGEPDKIRGRYLRGRVWVDDQDLFVVKVSGEVLPEEKGRRTPRFETYFQNHDKYWFPAYCSGEDRIRIDKYPTRVAVKLRFTGYKKVNSRG
jgi:hypothetical protein